MSAFIFFTAEIAETAEKNKSNPNLEYRNSKTNTEFQNPESKLQNLIFCILGICFEFGILN